MTEANIQTLFSKYMNNMLPCGTCAYELKLVKGKSKPFDCVAEHQIKALLSVEVGRFYYKIPDTAAISGYTSPKPFDCMTMAGKAYVVPVFYIPRKRKTAYLIKVADWIGMQENADRKSFTEDMCLIAAEEVIEL